MLLRSFTFYSTCLLACLCLSAGVVRAAENKDLSSEDLSIEVSDNVELPSQESIQKGKLALVWCTNSVGRISRGQMYDNQIISAKERYFSKREGLENEPHLMGYVPKDGERPAISDPQDRPQFEGKTYREMIRYCDEVMMEAYNRVQNKPKPTNIAEVRIANTPNPALQKEMLAEQDIGKQKGFKGVAYGISELVMDLQSNKYSFEEVKPFLFKLGQYDHSWQLTSEVETPYGPLAAYEMWAGSRPMVVLVFEKSGKSYSLGSNLYDGYYELLGIDVVMVQAGASVFHVQILVMEEV